jgi:hypothetical protein
MYETEEVPEEGMSIRSPFAIALERLLDDTGLFSKREQWARILGVTPAAISQWVQDKTVPRPEVLRILISVIKSRTKIPRRFIEEFEQLAALPAAEASPKHGHRVAKTAVHYGVGNTFAHYMTAPVLEAFLRNLSALPPRLQEDVLTSASEKCLDTDLEGGTTATAECGFALSEEEERLLMLGERHNDSDLRVVSGQELMSYLDSHKGLHAVGDSVRMDLVGMFNTEHDDSQQQGDVLPTCTVVLWKMPPQRQFDSFPLNEMVVYMLRGKVKWQYSDARPITLGSGPGEHCRLRIRAAVNESPTKGLPPFSVETVGDEPAIGLAVLYSRAGVRLQSVNSRQVEMQTTLWSADDIRQYWEAVRLDYREDTSSLLASDAVPSTVKELDQYINDHQPPGRRRDDVHDEARKAGQISDADLDTWDDERAGVLETRIVKVHAAMPQMKEDNIWMGRHEGKEIFVPLRGAFKYVAVEPIPSEVEGRSRPCGKFKENRRKRGFVRSTEYSNLPLSDVLLLDSSNWHGFSGLGGDAYCLHIRCRAPQYGKSKNSLSESGKAERRELGNARRVAGARPSGSNYSADGGSQKGGASPSCKQATDQRAQGRHASPEVDHELAGV